MSEMMENQAAEIEAEIETQIEGVQAVDEQAVERGTDDENPMVAKRRKWSAFVEGAAADFFTGYKLEKMSIDDGNGNKAKFSRTKDEGIKVEYTSAVML